MTTACLTDGSPQLRLPGILVGVWSHGPGDAGRCARRPTFDATGLTNWNSLLVERGVAPNRRHADIGRPALLEEVRRVLGLSEARPPSARRRPPRPSLLARLGARGIEQWHAAQRFSCSRSVLVNQKLQ